MHRKPFLTAVKTLRERARRHLSLGAVTPGYGADRAVVLKVLNEALATEIVCMLRYKRHQYTARGLHAQSVVRKFAEHAAEEARHADRIAERIMQLGGKADYSPATLALRSHSEYVEGADLADMIEEDLVAERIAVESYGEFIRYLGSDDPTTRRLMETILENEEEHADDLASLLEKVAPRTTATQRVSL